MVRETRHLWVGNLPENISEERIREHFKRYGPVQSVKVVSGGCDDGVCAAVAFVDICSAAKAHKADHRIEERLLKTTYYEPSLTAFSTSHYPSSGSSLHRETAHYSPAGSQANSHLPHGARSPRFSAGLNEDHNSYERSSHVFYESRRDETIGYSTPGGPSLSGGPVGSGVQSGMRRGYPNDRDAEFSAGARGRVRSYPSRHFLTNGRAEPSEYRWGAATQYRYHADASYVEDKIRRGSQGVSPPPPLPRPGPRNPRITIPSNKRRLPTSRSGSESPSSSRSSRSSSSSSSSSSSRSSSSRSGSLGRSSRSNSRSPRRMGNASQSVTVVPILSPPGEKRPLAISVKNLPPWSSDNSLKDGLFHDYKKHGKVTTVRIFGSGSDRYAVVCFKKPEDAEKACDASQDKQFFGVKIQVSPHEGLELDENEFRSYDIELDEYHPKATRTLFIGGLDKDVTAAELRKHFEAFGEIIEIDIKKQNSSTFAFCQYSDIRSVVQAVKKMDGEHLGGNRIKLGFGKSLSNRYIWVGGVADGVTEAVLYEHFGRFGSIMNRNVDREKGHALIAYESERHASSAVTEMRGCVLGGKRLQTDFASRECQVAFYENLKQEFSSPSERTWERRESDKYDRGRREGSFINRQLPGQRIQAYPSSRSRTRYEEFEEYPTGRSFDFADNSFERDLHEYAGRQRYENGPSSTAPHHTPTSTTLTTTAAATSATVVAVAAKHRGLSPARKRDDKSPHSPQRSSLTREPESLSPLIRSSFEDTEARKGAARHRSTSDHDSFHSQSPPPRGRNSASRMPSHSPSTPLATSPSREVTVVEDPRRRKPSDFKDLVVRVSDMRRPSVSPVRHRNNHRLPPQDAELDDGDSFPGKNEPQDPRLILRRDETFSSGDERSLDGERVNKKPKFADAPLAYDKALKRSVEVYDYRARDHSPSFRKPFDSRKCVESSKFSKKESRPVDDPLRSPQSDPRNRKTSMSGGSDIDESSPWRNRDISFSSAPCADGEFLSDASPPGTPVRDEREDPPPEASSCRRSSHSFANQREKHTSPLCLPLPKFAQQVRPHLSPRGACASPRGGGLLRSPTFNTGTNWNLPSVETNHTVEESDPILADTPVSPGPAMHDSLSDSEESPSVSPSNTACDLYERIKALDEKYEKWTGSTRSFGKALPLSKSSTNSTSDGPIKTTLAAPPSRKKRILDLEELKSQEPSDIMKSLLSKRSVFDEDSERLENISDKYEPRPFSSMPRSKGYSSLISLQSLSTPAHCSTSHSTTTTSITCTVIPIPSATPLNSLPGIRRPSTSISVSSPQMTKTTPPSISSPSLLATGLSQSVSTTAVATPTSRSIAPKTPSLSGESYVQTTATTAATTTTATSSTSASSQSQQPSSCTTVVTTSVVSTAPVHSRRQSSGSSVSTPGPPSSDIKTEASSSPPVKISEAVVTVSPDTRVSGSVSVIQTSCSKVSFTTTQSLPSPSVLVSPSLDMSFNYQFMPPEEKEKAHIEVTYPQTNAPCEKKVLKEKEQVRNTTSLEMISSKETLPAADGNKNKIKEFFNNTSFKSDPVNSKIKIEPADEALVEMNQVSEVAGIHKRRLSSTDTEPSDRRPFRSSKETSKSDTKLLEPDCKKLKLEQEEEKENKSTKASREKETYKSERRERIRSGRKEEPKESAEDKLGMQITTNFANPADSLETKQELKHKREEKQDLKEKLESTKVNEVKEEKSRESEREKRREKHEDKEKSHTGDAKQLLKTIHAEKPRSVEKVNERKVDEKKDIKEEKSEEKEEKRKEVKEEVKLERREEKEEKLRDHEKRRHSEDSSKSREDKKERSRDKREKEKLRERERHRSSLSHSDRDGERERVRDRDKEKVRVPERGKEKSKQRHSKPNAKSDQRGKQHSVDKHCEKKIKRELSSISLPSSDYPTTVNSMSEKSSSKKSQSQSLKPVKLDLDEESDVTISSTVIGHKSHQSVSSSKGKETTDKAECESSYQDRLSKDTFSRKKHDPAKADDKCKSHSSRKIASSHFPKSKNCVADEDLDRAERLDSEDLTSEDENKEKSPLQPAKRTKQRATSSSSGSRRGRTKNKSILDTESESIDSESDSEHKPKKPSYFDITIYDGNMYDKVKARRVKLEQKRDDDSKQQEIKQKLLQQRNKRSRKPPTNSNSAIVSESEDTDNDAPKKRGHSRIPSSSEEDGFLQARQNHLSSEESDAISVLGKREKSKKKSAKDFKVRIASSKVSHVSDITTDDEVTGQHPRPHSGTESDTEHRTPRKEVLKIESDSEMSETGNRKPPRPALSVSRARVREKDHKSNRISDKTHLLKDTRLLGEDIALMGEEVRQHTKPKVKLDPAEGGKVSGTEKRKYSETTNSKEKVRREGRMKAIFGLMSDDSDSNAPPPNLPLTPPDLISTTYRKRSASSGASSETPNMTPPMQARPQPVMYEFMDDDFRPPTPDIPSQKRIPNSFETNELEKSDLHHSEYKSFIGHNIKEMLQQESPISKEDILSPSWREVREQTVKEVVCEASRAASDSGKGSSCGVSTTSSSSGSSAEELLLLEATSSAAFREEPDNNIENTSSKNFSFSRESEIRESVPRKDKRKKKKHKDKESNRSHRHSGNKDSHGHSLLPETKSLPRFGDVDTHNYKIGSVREEPDLTPPPRKEKPLLLPPTNNNLIKDNDSSTGVEEQLQPESTDSREEIAVVSHVKKSPPLDMPLLKLEEPELEPENKFLPDSDQKLEELESGPGPDRVPVPGTEKESKPEPEAKPEPVPEPEPKPVPEPEPEPEPEQESEPDRELEEVQRPKQHEHDISKPSLSRPEAQAEAETGTKTEKEKSAESTCDKRESDLSSASVNQESAVQSIATRTTPSRSQALFDEIADGSCSPAAESSVDESPTKPSRSTISQEETLNAVAGLLACYNDYQEETSPTPTEEEPILHSEPAPPIEDPTDQSEEAQKAAQMLQSEIGVGRETEERDENWVENLPINESVENVVVDAPPQVILSTQSSTEPVATPPAFSPAKKEAEQTNTVSMSPKRRDVVNPTPFIKECPLPFPDSPSSVQSEPALQIDEDEQTDSLEANLIEEKSREITRTPHDRSSVWNTPESDIQDAKLISIEEPLPCKPSLQESETERLENDPNQELNKSDEGTKDSPQASEMHEKDSFETNHSESTEAESPVERPAKEYKPVIEHPDTLIETKSTESFSADLSHITALKDSVKNEKETESFSSNSELKSVSQNQTIKSNELTDEVSKKSDETLVAKPEQLEEIPTEPVAVEEQCSQSTPLSQDQELTPPVKDENIPEVKIEETENQSPKIPPLATDLSVTKEEYEKPPQSLSIAKVIDTPIEDKNTESFVEKAATDSSAVSKEESKVEELDGNRIATRGRAGGRGRRGGRRLTEPTVLSGASSILTRSSITTRNSKSRGRGRNARNVELVEEDPLAETITPEQPRRSTRQKRARKHPDMVEHDETTNRRKRGGRGGKISGDEAALRANLSSSDVYDFHDSDEDEVGMALGKKGKKEVAKPPTPSRSPTKAGEECIENQVDSTSIRKSRRLRDKAPDEEAPPVSDGEQEGDTPPPPVTRSRGRVRKDADGEDDFCSTPRKSPRSRSKVNEIEPPEGDRNIIGVNETPVGEVVIQKVEPLAPTSIPVPVTLPSKTLIIPCTSTKSYTSSNISSVSTHVPTMSISTVPAVYSSSISSHPVKVSIVPSGVRTIAKGTPVACLMTPQVPASIPNPNPSLLTVTSVPVSSHASRENVVSQATSFSLSSAKDTTPSPLKTVVSINCSPVPHSPYKTFPTGKKPDTIPTPLVDPVTGHLTPMKMSDEGHYIPMEQLSFAAKDKVGLTQSLQTKILRTVLPSISVTTVTNSSPSISVSIPSTPVSTLSSNRSSLSLSTLPKSVAVTSLTRGSEVSVELVSRTRASVPSSTAAANILLSTPKGLPSFTSKSPLSVSPSSHSPTNPTLPNTVISSHVSLPQPNSPNLVTITTPGKHFTTTNTTLMTNTSTTQRGQSICGPIAQMKGPIPNKLQPISAPKVSGNTQPSLNVQSIILKSPAGPLHTSHTRSEYTPQVITASVPPQPLTSSPGSIGTVSVSRIPSTRSGTGPTHEPSHITELVSIGVPPRYPDQSPRYRETPIVEVARLHGAAPTATLSPVARVHEPEVAHMSSKQPFDLHHAATNIHNRQGGMRNSPSGTHGHVQSAVATKTNIPPHFFGDMHKKNGGPQPLTGVPPGPPRYLASPPLHTPPSTQTPPPPPPAHHNNQRDNLQMNPMNPIYHHRGPYIVSEQRNVYGEKIPTLTTMPIDLKVIEKSHPGDKVLPEEKERPVSGTISLNEFASRPSSVITPHNPSSPHHLPSPHYDRSTDSPQVTMMSTRRYQHYDGSLYPNRSGTPGIEHESLPRSPAPLPYPPMPTGENHPPPRVQIPPPQYSSSQVSPQLPPQTETLQYLLQNYPVMWDGMLGLKNEQALVKMHFISGSMEVARGALPEGSTSHIRISQRMRLEQSQLEGVARKMQMKAEHCILMALPYGRNHYDLIQQQFSLETGFIKYLGEDKKAAGIVNVYVPGSQQSAYVIHIFPPCDFANENLFRIAPDLLHGIGRASRLLVVIATC